MNIAEIIKKQTNLKESEEVIHTLLIELYLYKRLSTKQMAGKVSLPLPIAAAIKKELKKLGFVLEQQGTSLTRKGCLYVEQQLGWKDINKKYYLKLRGSVQEQEALKNELILELRQGISNRPVAAVVYDQAFATIETIVDRAFLLLEQPDFPNRNVLFLGDDDLTSLAVALLLKKLRLVSARPINKLTVYELSTDIIQCIEQTAQELGVAIQCQQIDFRQSAQHDFERQFDSVFVDSPYTFSGLKLFLSRAVSCSKPGSSRIFLSYGEKDPKNQLAVQQLVTRQNLIIQQIRPKFNQYTGAAILGGVSTLYELYPQQDSYAMISAKQSYQQPIYTGEVNPRRTVYQCKNCQETYIVGANVAIQTIEALKMKTCSTCGHDHFLRIVREDLPKSNERQHLGDHYLVELTNCSKEGLMSVASVEQKMLEITAVCGLTAVTHHFHQFSPWGVSGVVILSESHFTIHTWPEEQYAAVDLFVCQDLPSKEQFISLLSELFGAEAIDYQQLERGQRTN